MRVVDSLAKTLGTGLKAGPAVVGKKSNGEDAVFVFDGLDKERTIGVLVSTTSSTKTGVLYKLFRDATLLNRAQFQVRIMVFTDRRVWRCFHDRYEGQVDLEAITPKFADELPEEVRGRIAQIQAAAKHEVGDKSVRL